MDPTSKVYLSKELMLLRFPLHSRDNPELFIESEFNSIFDELFVKSLSLTMVSEKLNDVLFYF
jgi:hypothetical protein